jgi:hypothetical protein
VCQTPYLGGLEDTLPEERETCPPIALAEVVDEMKPMNCLLHGVGPPATDAIRIQIIPIATDDGDGWMLGEPSRHRRGRAIRQEVHDPMTGQIDEDGTIAVAPPPGPLVDADHATGGAVRPSTPFPSENGNRQWPVCLSRA